MIPGKQKIKLEQLISRSAEIKDFSDEHLTALGGILKEYSVIIRRLHDKEPNIFSHFVKHDLKEIKRHGQTVHEIEDPSVKKQNFLSYKQAIDHSIESAIVYIKDYVSQQ